MPQVILEALLTQVSKINTYFRKPCGRSQWLERVPALRVILYSESGFTNSQINAHILSGSASVDYLWAGRPQSS